MNYVLQFNRKKGTARISKHSMGSVSHLHTLTYGQIYKRIMRKKPNPSDNRDAGVYGPETSGCGDRVRGHRLLFLR